MNTIKQETNNNITKAVITTYSKFNRKKLSPDSFIKELIFNLYKDSYDLNSSSEQNEIEKLIIYIIKYLSVDSIINTNLNFVNTVYKKNKANFKNQLLELQKNVNKNSQNIQDKMILKKQIENDVLLINEYNKKTMKMKFRNKE